MVFTSRFCCVTCVSDLLNSYCIGATSFVWRTEPELNRLRGHVTCSINQVETKIQKGLLSMPLLDREASYSRWACRSGCCVVASHNKRRSAILTPQHPFNLHMIDDGRSSVESPLSFIHCTNQEWHYKIQLLTKLLFRFWLP